jgi:23S rRNA (uracil1939-C5)-methyltransferase
LGGLVRATIEKLIYGGDGLARVDDAAVFVPFVLPGEDVELQITESKKKFQRGEITSLLIPSPQRVQPRCPYFTKCGGCQYQHVSYQAQLHYKEEILRETLRRIGGVNWTQSVTVHPSPPWQYRNRAQWKIRPADDLPGAPPTIGYMRAASSALCAVDQCPIISPLLENTLASFVQWLANQDDFAAEVAKIREIEAFADHADERFTLTLQFSRWPSDPQHFADALHERLPRVVSLLFRNKSGEYATGFGSGSLEYHAANAIYQVSHDSFFQVNRFLVDTLVERVISSAGAGEIALDLFAGVGLFTLPLAKNLHRVSAVEGNPAAVQDLRANIGRAAATSETDHAGASSGRPQAGTPNVDARQADVSQFLRKPPREVSAADVVIIDPPRTGIPPEALPRLCKLQPRKIIYVSCEPSTLARDLAVFRANDYSLTALELFDHFPQTFHIESLAILERDA